MVRLPCFMKSCSDREFKMQINLTTELIYACIINIGFPMLRGGGGYKYLHVNYENAHLPLFD